MTDRCKDSVNVFALTLDGEVRSYFFDKDKAYNVGNCKIVEMPKEEADRLFEEFFFNNEKD